MKIYIQREDINGLNTVVGEIKTNQNAVFYIGICGGSMTFESDFPDGTVRDLLGWINKALIYIKKYPRFKYQQNAIKHAECILLPKLQHFEGDLKVTFLY